MQQIKAFERSEKYNTKIFLDAIDQDVILDAIVVCQLPSNHANRFLHCPKRTGHSNLKLKAYCPATKTYLQFPNRLRTRHGQTYMADVVKSRRKTGKVFYRAYRGSIRDSQTGEVVG